MRIASMLGGVALLFISGVGQAQAQESFADPATGFSLRVPAGFSIRNRRSDPNHDVLVDIASETGRPPVAGNSAAVCAAGFKRTPPGFDQSLADLRALPAMQAMALESRRRMEEIGIAVQTVDAIEREDAAAFEMTAIPKTGPDHANVRLYFAIMDRPVGRADVVCATTADAMQGGALDVFHAIRDGVSVAVP